jgi:flagellar biosynthesis chaperone FliJ
MYRRQSRNSKTIKIKNMRRHKKQTREFIRALNKYQSEAENTINKDIIELRMKIDNIKEEVTHGIETLEKK